jgi:hypothetical protein
MEGHLVKGQMVCAEVDTHGHGLAVAEWVHHGGICPVSYNYTSVRNTVLKVLKHHSWRTDFGKIYFPEEEGAYRLRRGKY